MLDRMRCFYLFILLLPHSLQAQFSISGTYDGYAALSKKGMTHLPFMVSHAKLGAYDINLLEIELAYSKNQLKFQFSPAIGSYMQNNYAAEAPYRRFIFSIKKEKQNLHTELLVRHIPKKHPGP